MDFGEVPKVIEEIFKGSPVELAPLGHAFQRLLLGSVFKFYSNSDRGLLAADVHLHLYINGWLIHLFYNFDKAYTCLTVGFDGFFHQRDKLFSKGQNSQRFIVSLYQYSRSLQEFAGMSLRIEELNQWKNVNFIGRAFSFMIK